MKQKQRMLTLMFIDIIVVNISILFSFLIRFEGKIPTDCLEIYYNTFWIITGIKIVLFYLLGMYRQLWRYASMNELVFVIVVVTAANAGVALCFYVAPSLVFLAERNVLPRSIYVLTWLLDILFIGGIRFAYRVYRQFILHDSRHRKFKKRALIIGAGDAGNIVIKELLSHENSNTVPVAVIDDDLMKQGRKILGVPVVGTRANIVEKVKEKKIDEIIIAIPSMTYRERREIINICKDTNLPMKMLPGVYELIEGKVGISHIRPVRIEDLLGRDPVSLDIETIGGYLKDKVVMVTGGGGSIGSELCRQIAHHQPKLLLILDIYENNAYDIQNELKSKFPTLPLKVLIASVRERERMSEIFATYGPEVVFHAAAHKHVPLMEDSPTEAIKNNIFGTWNIIELCDQFGVKKMVQISTDKAVNPTNVMGATKRFCEMLIQAYDKESNTEFVAVRFGNVLGSNGSVIPLFKKQILNGGPVTVTHPEIIRYFMTISEAVQLVLQAGGMAKGGEIFVLDMGEPVKIDKLAKDLIRLSGLELNKDIEIKYTGLRPGEKLYEELLMEEEGLTSTKHQKIYVAKPMDISKEEVTKKLKHLQEILHKNNEYVIQELKEVVPTYRNGI
ncbi:MAG: polysaccharide biosynthesis protein [Epulopiscium sp.]|nr:polysaccharide biosynthesis protein [Candidatus Epulonipiscium sp.]